jgi:putative heme transporter
VAFLAGMYVLSVGLVLGVPLAPVAAVWYAVVSLIPQVGGFLGVSFFTILAISQGLVVGLIGLALVLAYMNAENYVISPAIVGRSVNLSPPTTMLAALVGGAALGVPGALAATPLCGTVKALYLEYRYGDQLDADPSTALERLQDLGPVKKVRERLIRRTSARTRRGSGRSR